jgi:hypothetical protein
VMNASTWVEIVSTTPLGAEPGGVESKHTCNAEHQMCASVFGAQNYRVKRLSACGGCLGDYRR